MKTKLVASTEAQNNFGRVLDDIVQNSTRYVIHRRNAPQAVILSIADLENILSANESERKKLEKIMRELSPVYSIGESIADQQV
jgi:prevent-host-death family protein